MRKHSDKVLPISDAVSYVKNTMSIPDTGMNSAVGLEYVLPSTIDEILHASNEKKIVIKNDFALFQFLLSFVEIILHK